MRYPFVLFDWGDTLMRDSPTLSGPMCQWPVVQAVDGAAEVLASLYPRVTVALATGAELSDEADIRAALKRVDLDRYVHKIYCFKNTGCHKPAPDFYEYVLRDLAADPADAVMIGDSFVNDVLGANRVGMHAVWLNHVSPEDARSDLHCTIHALRGLLPLLSLEEPR